MSNGDFGLLYGNLGPGIASGIEFDHLRDLLTIELGADLSAATPDSLLEEDLGWDSLTFLEVLALSERLGISLPEDLIGSLRTLGDVHASIDSHMKHSPGGNPGPRAVLGTSTTQLVPVDRTHEDMLWKLHTQGNHLVDFRLRGTVPSPERFHQMLWEGVLAQFLVAANDGRVVGLVSAIQPDFRNRHAHVSVIEAPEWQSSGLAIDGMVRLISYLFTQFDLRKVYAEVLERNLTRFASGENRWFQVEGRLTEHEYIDGSYEDMVVLATSREAWRQIHKHRFSEPAPF